MESMGVAGGHCSQEASVASGWNLWLWLEYISPVSGCCCKEVYRYPPTIIITFPYTTCITYFFGSNISISMFIFKMIFVLV